MSAVKVIKLSSSDDTWVKYVSVCRVVNQKANPCRIDSISNLGSLLAPLLSNKEGGSILKGGLSRNGTVLKTGTNFQDSIK